MTFNRFLILMMSLSLCEGCHANTSKSGFGGSLDCSNGVVPDDDWSIKALINRSDFIGLYTAHLIVDAPLPPDNSTNSFYNVLENRVFFEPNTKFQLKRSSIYKGNPPKIHDVLSYDTYSKAPPQEYFFADKYHQQVVDRDNIWLGFSYFLPNDGNVCELHIELTKDYRYLVFGNKNSNFFIEPILSLNHDPFYSEVVRLLELEKPHSSQIK